MAVVINGNGTVTGIAVGGLPDGIVDNGTMADDAVAIADLAATGTASSTTFLRGDNSWAAAGGGAWTLVGTSVASNSASLTITGLDSTYGTYAIAFSDMHPASLNSGVVKLRVGDSSGIDSGASDYHYHTQNMEAGSAGFSARTSTGEDHIELKASSGGDTGEGWCGLIYLHRPSNGVSDPMITGQIMGTDSTDTTKNFGAVYGRRTAVIALDRIQVLQATGNIESGRMTVWGLAHA